VAGDVEAEGADADANGAFELVGAELLEVLEVRDAVGGLVEVVEEGADGLTRGVDDDFVFESQGVTPFGARAAHP
jgi:hypothetical protein